VYLQRELDYDATVDIDTGEVTATATVTLTNTAPPSGLPASVIGDVTDDDPGTNRTLLSLYSALPIKSATVSASTGTGSEGAAEPAPFEFDVGTEAGWLVGSGSVVIPPGESVTVTYELAGTLPLPDGYTLAVRPQPIVVDELQRLHVTSADGVTLIDESGPATQPRVLPAR
jgi:hypothetical protein